VRRATATEIEEADIMSGDESELPEEAALFCSRFKQKTTAEEQRKARLAKLMSSPRRKKPHHEPLLLYL
jgi:hypothetical protein